jgi:hypothetical protein
MNERRLRTLKAKGGTVGLSDSEASELGHLFAQAEHKPYVDAAEERLARTKRERSLEERNPRRRWSPFRVRRWARSLEIGQTASLTEDVDRIEKDLPKRRSGR